MKRFFKYGVTLAVCAITLSSCNSIYNDELVYPSVTTEAISDFERGFAQSRVALTRSSDEDNSVFLFGYQTIVIPEEYRSETYRRELDQKIKSLHKVKEVDLYLAEDGSFMRVYFPLYQSEVVEYGNKKYFSDEDGTFKNDIPIDEIGKLKIVGQKRTDNIRGTGHNTVTKDMILYRRKVKDPSVYQDQRAVFFNFGARKVGCANEEMFPLLKTRSESVPGRISCVDNHGGKNCSAAFGEKNPGRCPFNPGRCMDYNGQWTTCENVGMGDMFNRFKNWIGSDCCFHSLRCTNEYL